MGFDVNTVELLLAARTQGVDFAHVATLGRQEFYRMDARALQGAFRRWWGVNMSDERARQLLAADGGFVEAFLRELGAEQVTAIDASPFEGATLLHDLNREIPAGMENRFSAIIDGGTLEHIFNFPVAIKNCMRMLRVGGHFIGVTPTNNFMGHGLYQFSPELFYIVFSPENGFCVERMILFESEHEADWYEVADPHQRDTRVQLVNYRPTFLYVQARKQSAAPVLEVSPQQCDYVASWSRAPQPSGVGQLSHERRLNFWIMASRRASPPIRNAYQIWRLLRRFRKDGLRKLNRRDLIGSHVPAPPGGGSPSRR